MVTASSAVRIVLFDAVGTLITPCPAAHEVYYHVGRAHGSRLSMEDVRRRFGQLRSAAAHETAADGTTGPARERERWRQWVARVFVELPTAGQTIFPELWDHFARPQHWQVDVDVASLWPCLLDRGLRIGIASNFDERLETLCRQLTPLNSAEFVFHSAQLGARKPDGRFFRAIQRRLDVPPASLLMVGDDRSADYRGARQAGWQAIWLDRSECGGANCPRSITRLSQLADRLRAD